MVARAVLVLVVVSAAVAAGAGWASAGELKASATARLGFPLVEARALDLGPGGRQGALLVGRDGEVRVYRRSEGGVGGIHGALTLPDPAHSLLAVGDVLGTGGAPQLAVLSPSGLRIHVLEPGGGFAAKGKALGPRRKGSLAFTLRVGRPRFAAILRDVTGDGLPDVFVPKGETCEIWTNRKSGEKATLRKAATVNVDLKHTRTTEGKRLSDELDSSFRIPSLRFTDVNGDGRPDLVVEDRDRRHFHLQREDGAIPADPDVKLNLDIFRDTTPEAEIRPGRVLAGIGDSRFQMQDLDADGIPDYVISHRRKIWVFHGSRAGPEFTKPTTILKVAEDVTTLLLVPLDGGDHPDLLLFRLVVPTVVAIMRGLFAESEIEIRVAGYRSEKGRGFEKTPTWKSELKVRLPEIVGVMRNPEALIRRFEEATSKFRDSVTGDFDGDGESDVAMVTPDHTRVEIWRKMDREAARKGFSDFRFFLFEDPNRVWTIERILSWLGGEAERRAANLTGDRPPDAAHTLRDPDRHALGPVLALDLDGDGRSEVILITSDRQLAGEGVLEVLRLK